MAKLVKPVLTKTYVPLFGKENYRWMLIGLVLIGLGLIAMAGGKSKDPNVFDPKEVYSFTRITIAPILIIAGLALSLVLTFVINKAFFGWTIQMAYPWATVLLTPFWIVCAALLAGWLPARQAGRIPIAAAIRSE